MAYKCPKEVPSPLVVVLFLALVLGLLGSCDNPFTGNLGERVTVWRPYIQNVSPGNNTFLSGQAVFTGEARAHREIRRIEVRIGDPENPILGWTDITEFGGTVSSTTREGSDGLHGNWNFAMDTLDILGRGITVPDGRIGIRFRVFDNVEDDPRETIEFVFNVKNEPPIVTMNMPSDELVLESDGPVIMAGTAIISGDVADRRGLAPGFPMMQMWPVERADITANPDYFADDDRHGWFSLFLSNTTPSEINDNIETGFYESRYGKHIDFADFSFRFGSFTIMERQEDGVRMAVFDGANMIPGEYFFRIMTRDIRYPDGIEGFFPPYNHGNDPEGPNPPNPFKAGPPIHITIFDNADPPTITINNHGALVDLTARPNIYITGIRESKIAADTGSADRDIFRLQVRAQHPHGINLSGAAVANSLTWQHIATGRSGTFTPDWKFYPGGDREGNRTDVLFTFTATGETRDDDGAPIFVTHPSEYELTITVHSLIGTEAQRLFSIRMDGDGPDVDIRRNVRGASPISGDFRRMHGGLVNDSVFTVNGNIQVSVDRSDPSLIMAHGEGMGAAHPSVENHPMVKWIVERVTPGFDLNTPPGGSVIYRLNGHRDSPSRATLDFFYDIGETPHSGWVNIPSVSPDPVVDTHNFKFATTGFDDGDELWLYVIAMDGVYNLGFAMQRLLVNQEADRPVITAPDLFTHNAGGTQITGPGHLEVAVGADGPDNPGRDGNWTPYTPRRNTLGHGQGIDLVFSDDDGIRLGDITVRITDLSTPGLPYATVPADLLADALDGSARQWAGTLTQAAMAEALNRAIYSQTFHHPSSRLRDGMYRIYIRVYDYDGYKVQMDTGHVSGFNYNHATFWFAVHTGSPQITVDYPADNSLQGLYPPEGITVRGTVRTPFVNMKRLWITFTPDVITPAHGGGRSIEITDFTRIDTARGADGFYTFAWEKRGVVFGDYPDRGQPNAGPFPGENRDFTVRAFDALGFEGTSSHRVQVDTTSPDVSLIGINQGRPFITDGPVVVTDVWGNVRFDVSATDNHGMAGVKWWLVPSASASPNWESPFLVSRGSQFGGEFENPGDGIFSVVFNSRHLNDGSVYRLYLIAVDNAGNDTRANLARITVNQAADAPELDEGMLGPANNVVRRFDGDGSLWIRGVARDTDGFDRESGRLLGLNAGDAYFDENAHRGYVQIRFASGEPLQWGDWINVSGNVNAVGELHFGFDASSVNISDGTVRYRIRVWDEEAGKNPQKDLDSFADMDWVSSVSRGFPAHGYFSFVLDTTPPRIEVHDIDIPVFQSATDLLGYLAGTVDERNLSQLTVTFEGESVQLINNPAPRPPGEYYEWNIVRILAGYSLFNMGRIVPFPRSYVRQVHPIPAPESLTPATQIITIGGRDDHGNTIPSQYLVITLGDLPDGITGVSAIDRRPPVGASVFDGTVLFETTRKYDPLAPGNIFHRFVVAEQGGQSIAIVATDRAGNEPSRDSLRFVLDTQGPDVLLYTISRAISHGEVRPAGGGTEHVYINDTHITESLFPADWPSDWPREGGFWKEGWSDSWKGIVADWPSDFAMLSPATVIGRLRDEINRRPTVVVGDTTDSPVVNLPVISGRFVDAISPIWGINNNATFYYRFNSAGRAEGAGTWVSKTLVRDDQQERSARWEITIPAANVSGGLMDGVNTFDIRFSDQAGNITEIFGLRFVVDREMPFLFGDRDFAGNVIGGKDDAGYFLVNATGGTAVSDWATLAGHRRVFSALGPEPTGERPVFQLRGRVHDANLREIQARISSDGPSPYLVIATMYTEFAEGESPMDMVGGAPAALDSPSRLSIVRLRDDDDRYLNEWEWMLDIFERDVYAMHTMSGVSDGTRRHVTMTATDLAGRRSQAAVWEFFLDSTHANIDFRTPEPGEYFARGTAELSGSVNDYTGVREVSFRIERLDYATDTWQWLGDWHPIIDNNATEISPSLVDWTVNAGTLAIAGYPAVFGQEGQYRIHIRAKDWSLGWGSATPGNPGTSQRLFFVDDGPPEIVWPTDTATGEIVHSRAFNDGNLAFDFTVSDPNTVFGPGEGFVAEIRQGGPGGPTVFSTADVGGRLVATFTPVDKVHGIPSWAVALTTDGTGLGADGTYTLVLRVLDAAGRMADENQNFTFTLDNTSPNLAVINHPGAGTASVGRMSIRGTTAEIGSGLAGVEFTLIPNPGAVIMSDAQIRAAMAAIPVDDWVSPTEDTAGILIVGNTPLMQMEAGAGIGGWTINIENTRHIIETGRVNGIGSHNFSPSIIAGRPHLDFGGTPVRDDGIVHLMILAVRATDMAGNLGYTFEHYWIYPRGDQPTVTILSPRSANPSENLLSGRFTISGMAQDNQRVQNVFFRVLDLDGGGGPFTNLAPPGFRFVPGVGWEEDGTQSTTLTFSGMPEGFRDGWYMARGGRLPTADWRITLNENGELNPPMRGSRRIRIEAVAKDSILANPAAPQDDASWHPSDIPTSDIVSVEAFVVDGAPVFGEPYIRTFALSPDGTAFTPSADWRRTYMAHVGGSGRATFRFTVSHETGLSAIQYRETIYNAATSVFSAGANVINIIGTDDYNTGTGPDTHHDHFEGLNRPVNPTGPGIAVRAEGRHTVTVLGPDDYGRAFVVSKTRPVTDPDDNGWLHEGLGNIPNQIGTPFIVPRLESVITLDGAQVMHRTDAGMFEWIVFVDVNTARLAGGAFQGRAINFELFITALDLSTPTHVPGSLHATMPIDNIPPQARFDLNTQPAGFAVTLGGSANSGYGDNIGGVDRVIAWFERVVPDNRPGFDPNEDRVRMGISWNSWGGNRNQTTLDADRLAGWQGNFWGEATTIPRSDFRATDPAGIRAPEFVRLPRLGPPGSGTPDAQGGGNFAIVVDRSGSAGHHGHQVSMSMASGVPGTLGTIWHFVIDSTFVPSGPTELHFVAFDLAGNASHFVQTLTVMNDAPLIGSIQIATDLRGGDLQNHLATGGFGTGNINTRSGIMARIRDYWHNRGIPAGSSNNANENDDIRRGISPWMIPYTQVTGSPVYGAMQFVENITVRNRLLAVGVETLLEPGAGLLRTFTLEYVSGTEDILGAGLADGIRAGYVYVIDNPGDGSIPWQLLGAAHSVVRSGYAFLATTNASDVLGVNWAAAGGAVRKLKTAHTLDVEFGANPGAPGRSAEFAYTSTGAFHGNGAISDYDPDNNLTGLFVLRVFDGPKIDGFTDLTVLRLRVNNNDGTRPFAQLYDMNPHAQAITTGIVGRHPHDPAPPAIGPMVIGHNLGRPGLWRDLHTNMSRPGNIEPRGDTGLTNTQLTGGSRENLDRMSHAAFFDVDTVSGRVILRGYAEDDQRIGRVELVFGGGGTETLPILVNRTAGEPATGNAVANEPAKTGLLEVSSDPRAADNVFFTDSIDLFRHRVEWAFVWDTALIPENIVVGNVTVRAVVHPVGNYAEPSERRPLLGNNLPPRPDSSDVDITDHRVRNPGFPGNLPMYNDIQVNIRPYITGFRRNVDMGFNDTRFDSRGNLLRGTRTLQGRYSLARGEHAVVTGFNLGRTGLTTQIILPGRSNVDDPASPVVARTVTTGNFAAGPTPVPTLGNFDLTDANRADRYQAFTVPDNAATGNGIVRLRVGNFYALNTNVERYPNTGQTSAANRVRPHMQPWHLENDTSLQGTDLWDNHTEVHIWRSDNNLSMGQDQGSFPARADNADDIVFGASMSIDPRNGMLHASHNIGGPGNAGRTFRSTNRGNRSGSPGATQVAQFVDPIINSSIFVNDTGDPWAVFSVVGRNGGAHEWQHVGGVWISAPAGAGGPAAFHSSVQNVFHAESAWYNASILNSAGWSASGNTAPWLNMVTPARNAAGFVNPASTEQFRNMRVITHIHGGNEYIHVSYFDSLDGSIKYRFNRRNTAGILLGNSGVGFSANNVARGWTNLDGGFDADDWVRLAATPTAAPPDDLAEVVVPPFTFVEEGGRIVNYLERTVGPTPSWRRIWAGEHNDIAVTSDGRPVVVYFNSTDELLRMAISHNRTPYRGDAWSIVEHVIPQGNPRAFGTGQYVSMRIDTVGGDGRAIDTVHIAAFNSERNELVYITGSIVGNAWIPGSVLVVDSVGNVGRRTRISLDDRGNPWIAYFDERNVGGMDGVKVAFFNPDFENRTTWQEQPLRDAFNGDISGWETMHVPAHYRVVDERDFMIRSQLGMENFPTRNVSTTAPRRFWSAAVGFLSNDLFRIAYWVE